MHAPQMNTTDILTNAYSCLTNAYSCLTNAYSCLTNAYNCLTNAYSCLTNAYNCLTNAYNCLTNKYYRNSDKCIRLLINIVGALEDFSLNWNGETRRKANYLYPATKYSSFSVLEPVVQILKITEHRNNSES